MGKILHGGFINHRATYQCWQDMRQRCNNPRSAQYKNYGARGISVCKEWQNDFAAFFRDMGEKPKGFSLDRIDNSGPYAPENCRWATLQEQNRNQRRCVYLEFNGERLTVTEWAHKIGICPDGLSYRLRAGWGIERALTQQVDNDRRRVPARGDGNG